MLRSATVFGYQRAYITCGLGRVKIKGPKFKVAHYPYPDWLDVWLWISYGMLFAGQIRAWWIPYLLRAEPKRAARFQIMFGKTHSFLPQRNGLVPNTAHILLHLATAATLLILLTRVFKL
jgi:hypothetical protein